MMLVGYFTLATVGNAVIRHPALNRQVVGTSILMTGVAGLLVAIVVLIAANPWAEIWRSPQAAPVIRLFAPQVLLGALAIVPVALVRRQLRFRTASVIETSAVLVGFAAGAALAFRMRNAEALVLGQVVGAAVLLALGLLAARAQLGLAYSRLEARGLFSFSAQVSLQNLGHYVNNTLPTFAVSRFLGQISLGFFSRASVLVGLPLTFLAQGATKTLYPIYPRFRTDKAECRRMMIDVTSVSTTLIWPLFGALAGLAPLVVELLLGSQWAPVASLVGPLCIYATVNFAYSIFSSFAESFGLLRQIWLIQGCWTAVLACSLTVAIAADADMRELVLAAAAVQVGIHIFQLGVLAREGLIDGGGTIVAEAWAALLAIAWYVATAVTLHSLADYSIVARAAGSAALVALLMVATRIALPYLPAGRAFSRRGIRILWLKTS
jgi:PST family polysaccharide transporter